MGDLFDGYGSTLAPRKTASGIPAFDEMFGVPSHPGDPAESREAYRELYQALAQMTQEELRGRTESLASSYLAQGVTFDFAGEERPFPLDAVPRVITFDEWSRVEAGVKQRVRALEAFLDDAYGRQHCVRDGVLPAGLIASSQYFYRQAAGIHSANGVRIQVSGIDLIRDENGEMRVLEDNVRVPSGVSYVISNRRVMAQTLPELFVSMRVRPVGDYPNKLLAALRASAPAGIEDPNVVVLTPGVYNSAYFEHTLLARLMGVELVEGRDLLCVGGKVFMRTTRGPQARRRDLPPRRRRVPGSAAVPRRLDARRARAHARGTPGQRHDRERGRQRRRRRQAALHVRARPHPLLPRRGADPQERRHVAARRPGRARGGARPARPSSWSSPSTARAARGSSWVRMPRPPSSSSCASGCSPIRAAGSRSRSSCSRRSRRSSKTGCGRVTPTCAPSR